MSTRVIRLASGVNRRIPADIENVVGVDSEGRIVVDWFDALAAPAPKVGEQTPPSLFGLTLCCNASDKGVEDGVVCRGCYGYDDTGAYHFKTTTGEFPDVDFLAAPAEASGPPNTTPPKEKRMSKKTPAAEQFAALRIDPKDFTPAMELAVKQKWSGLPVDEKVGDLRDRLAMVTLPGVPAVEALVADGMDEADAKAERARLLRNAKVNAWRTRNQIQAALDARDLRFRAMRAARSASNKADAPAAKKAKCVS